MIITIIRRTQKCQVVKHSKLGPTYPPTGLKQTHRLEEVGMAADHQEIAHVRLSQQILEQTHTQGEAKKADKIQIISNATLSASLHFGGSKLSSIYF
jgi:hypothetical protein